MKRILLIILCLFCLIGCKPVVEPEVVKLNEQEAMEYVKDFYSNGGSSRGGSSTHTSSSGRSHGGGGRRL